MLALVCAGLGGVALGTPSSPSAHTSKVIWPRGDPAVVVRSILKQPAYRTQAAADESSFGKLVDLVLQWIADRLRPIMRALGRGFVGTQSVGQVLGLLLIAASLGGLIYLVSRIALALVRDRRRTSQRLGTTSLGVRRSAEEWRALATAAAARGAYGEAIVALWNASLRVLDDRALVAFDPARTAGEYRRLVGRVRTAAAAPFDELALRFTYATFSQADARRSDYESAERSFGALVPVLGPSS